jgi:hypothetical protein
MTQDEIIALAEQAGMVSFELFGGIQFIEVWLPEIEAFAKLVAAKEREACAKVCETMARRTNDIRRAALEMAVENIMARGQG